MHLSTLRRPSAARPLRLIAAALALLLVPGAALALGNGKLQIHHMKVGQGDGTLLISPQGQTALFDDGVNGNCTYVKSYLQGLGITQVDYHFMSHYHADHLGCLDDLATVGITIGTTGYDRGASYSSATYTSYVNTLGTKRKTILKDQVITLDAAAATPITIKCVNLNGAGVYSPTGSDENAKSAVYKISYGAFDEVIGGDLTGDVASSNDVESTVGPQVGTVEVYKVHHHGSRYSTNNNWLTATRPTVAIIEVGTGNTYGHPTTEALSRLHTFGVKTYWTETGAGVAPNASWDKVGGTIVVQADPGLTDTYTVSGTGFTDTYTNKAAAAPMAIASATPEPTGPVLEGTASEAQAPSPSLVLPAANVRGLEGRSSAGGVELTWATLPGAHVDGFDVYRENAAGAPIYVGSEPTVETAGAEVRFHFVDPSPLEGQVSTYWIAARSCGGENGFAGPIRVAPARSTPRASR